MNLPLPASDKLAHFFYGSMIAVVFGDGAMLLWRQNSWTYSFAWNLVFGAMMALVFGLVKEYVLDARANAVARVARVAGKPEPNTVDPMDAVWTTAGGVATMVPGMIALHIVSSTLNIIV